MVGNGVVSGAVSVCVLFRCEILQLDVRILQVDYENDDDT